MKKNTNADLRDHMFTMIEMLDDNTLKGEELKEAIEKARQIGELGKIIIDVQKVDLLAEKIKQDHEHKMSKVLLMDMDPPKQLEFVRPPAHYTNRQIGDI